MRKRRKVHVSGALEESIRRYKAAKLSERKIRRRAKCRIKKLNNSLNTKLTLLKTKSG